MYLEVLMRFLRSTSFCMIVFKRWTDILGWSSCLINLYLSWVHLWTPRPDFSPAMSLCYSCGTFFFYRAYIVKLLINKKSLIYLFRSHRLLLPAEFIRNLIQCLLMVNPLKSNWRRLLTFRILFLLVIFLDQITPFLVIFKRFLNWNVFVKIYFANALR